MGRELRAILNEAGFVDIELTGWFEPFGSSSDVAVYASYLIDAALARSIADLAISHGIATGEDFNGWREAAVEWRDHPGAFATLAWGEATGRKP